MRTSHRRLALAAALAAAFAALAPAAAAQAATSVQCNRVHQQAGNGYGILNNAQVNVPVNLGLGLSGTALSLLGAADGGTHTVTITCGN